MASRRRKARIAALEILYQFDICNGTIADVVETQLEEKNFKKDVKDFILRLTQGVCEHRDEIEKRIRTACENWSLDRITIVDRNILRVAVFELLYCEDIPFKVIIDEAVELGKRYGTEQSGSFINGILDEVSKKIPLRKEEMTAHASAR